MQASKESKRAKKDSKKDSRKDSKKDSKKASEGRALPPQIAASHEGENGKGHGKVKFKGIMQHDEAVHYLEAILSGLRKGKLQFKQGEERVALAPSGANVRVEVKAEHKTDKDRLSLELTWHTGEDSQDKLEVD